MASGWRPGRSGCVCCGRRVSAEVCGDLAGGAGLPHGEKYLCGRMLQCGVSEYSVGASVCESCA